MSQEDRRELDPVLVALEQGLLSFEESEQQLRSEVFGKWANDYETLPPLAETVEDLKGVIAEFVTDKLAVQFPVLCKRDLKRPYKPPVTLTWLADPEDRLEYADVIPVDSDGHPAKVAPFRAKGVKHQLMYPKRSPKQYIMDKALERRNFPNSVEQEDIYIDLEDKPWIVRSFGDPNTGEVTKWAVKPASEPDLQYALHMIAAAARTDLRVRAEEILQASA